MNNSFVAFINKKAGFTLVELVIGIVVLAIALVAMSTLLLSQSKDAIEPIHRLRASQLGQSIIQNIVSRAYDENSDHNGGVYRCGEIWGDSNLWFDGSSWQTTGTPSPVACTSSANYGIDSGEVAGEHFNFNDVDDFIEDEYVGAVEYGNVLGEPLSSEMQNFSVKISVSPYNTVFKEITVTIKTPTNEEIVFAALKGNY